MKQLVGGFHRLISFSPIILLPLINFQVCDCSNLVSTDSCRGTNVDDFPFFTNIYSYDVQEKCSNNILIQEWNIIIIITIILASVEK